MRTPSGAFESKSGIVRGFSYLRPLRRLPRWVGLIFAFASVGAACVARQLLSGPLHGYPFMLFFPPIILTGVLFGHGLAFVAAAMSIGLSIWFVPPEGSFAVAREQVLPLVLFGVVVFVLAGAIELLQVAVSETVDREMSLKRSHEAEQAQQTLLTESEHRVRNDLSALASLLTLQSRRRPEAADVLTAAANQVRVLGRLYARFRQADAKAVVCSAEFLDQIVRDFEIAHFGDGSIRIVVAAERRELPFDVAATLALITNELVTNAAKYAFPDGRGIIEISFRREGGHDVLSVADDGVGLRGHIQGTGLGTSLLERLAGQMGGEFRRERRADGRGVIGTVIVPVREVAPPPPGGASGVTASQTRH